MMQNSIKKIILNEQPSITEGNLLRDNYLNLIGNLKVECLVRLGSLSLSVAELQQLKQGKILKLEQKTQEPIELLMNEKVIARGNLMSCDEQFAIQITEIYS